MPFCSNAITIDRDADFTATISLLSQEEFKAQAAHYLDNYQFNIETGMNDVSAIVDFEERKVRLFCRYASDVQRTNQKLTNFALNHRAMCEILEVSH